MRVREEVRRSGKMCVGPPFTGGKKETCERWCGERRAEVGKRR